MTGSTWRSSSGLSALTISKRIVNCPLVEWSRFVKSKEHIMFCIVQVSISNSKQFEM